MSVQSEINRINQNVAATYSVLSEAGAAMPASANTDNLAATAAGIKAVLYGKAQSLTDAQKAQARDNIGIVLSRGTGVLKVTTAPSAYTTATGGFTPAYRIALSTVESEAKVSGVLVGDTVMYSYYHYHVGYVDSSYVYLGERTSIRGATGAAGAAGAAGADGAAGVGITSITIEEV